MCIRDRTSSRWCPTNYLQLLASLCLATVERQVRGSVGSIPLAHGRPGTFYHGLRLFQFLQRGVVDVIFCSRGFGHARLIHFLFDAIEYRLVGFLLCLVLMHTRMMSRVQSDYRSIGNRAGSFRIVFGASSFAQSVPICAVSYTHLTLPTKRIV